MVPEHIIRGELDGAYPFYRMPPELTRQIAEEHLALRAIVEALAASEPRYFDVECDSGVCAICERLEHEGHEPTCPYSLAVALIGPASERTEG